MRRERQTAEHTPRHKKKKKAAGIVFTIYILLVILAVFVIDGRHPSFTVNGDKDMTLEVGEEYTELGAEATAVGRIFKNDGQPLEVSVTGDVDTSKVGEYKVVYHAKALFIPGSAVRHVSVVDTVAPVIELQHNAGQAAVSSMADYVEEGYTASDNYDGDITDKVERTVTDNGVIYTVSDSSGNKTSVERIVLGPPVLTLSGDTELELVASPRFEEPGYEAHDAQGNDLTDRVQVSGNIVPYKVGSYTLTYSVTNDRGEVTSVDRTVNVVAAGKPDSVKPDNPKTIYLTFDDGPGPFTEELLDVLARYNVKATFFVTALNSDYEDMIGRAYNEGHSIAVHTYSHDYRKIYASEKAFFDDFNAMEDVIYRQTGQYTKLCRFPGGSSNTVSQFNPGIMSRLVNIMNDMGYKYFDWNVDSDDAGVTKWTDGVYSNVVQGCRDTYGYGYSMVLQHDVKDYSVAAIESIINWGLNNGYTFAALDMSSPAAHHGLYN